MKKMKAWLQSSDLYGHDVSLNFKGRGNKFTTWLGFSLSLLMRVLLVSLFAYKLDKLIHRKDNKLLQTS